MESNKSSCNFKVGDTIGHPIDKNVKLLIIDIREFVEEGAMCMVYLDGTILTMPQLIGGKLINVPMWYKLSNRGIVLG